MQEIVPRYEYRAFAPGFGIVEQRLRQLGGQPAIRESDEIYLVSANAPDCNIKIRDDRLDIKLLKSQSRGWEQWSPAGKWSFPLHAEALTLLAEHLPIDTDRATSYSSGCQSFVDWMTASNERLVAVDIFKRRFGFEIDGCMAELAEVSVNGAMIQTACVESTDLEKAIALAERLGLDQFDNTSYVRALLTITGLVRRR